MKNEFDEPKHWVYVKYGIDDNILSLISQDVYERIVEGWKRIGHQLDLIDERLKPEWVIFEEQIYPHKQDRLRHSFLKGVYDFLRTYAIAMVDGKVCYDVLVYLFIATVGHKEVARAAYKISSPESEYNKDINKLMRKCNTIPETFWYITNSLACFGVKYLLNEKEADTLDLDRKHYIKFSSQSHRKVGRVYKGIVEVAAQENDWRDLRDNKELESWLNLPIQEKLKRMHTDGRLLDYLKAERKELIGRQDWDSHQICNSKNPISQEIAKTIYKETTRQKNSSVGDFELRKKKNLWENVVEDSILSEIQSALRDMMDAINPIDGGDKRKVRKIGQYLSYLSKKIEKSLNSQKPKRRIQLNEVEEGEYGEMSEDDEIAGMESDL